MIKVGPTGKVVTGHVMDVSKKALLEKLRDYDANLYVKWNPKKNNGNGLWEIRRRPDNLTAIPQGTYKGAAIYTLEYKENSLINHVLDVHILTYNVLTKLKSMDTWGKGSFTDNLEYNQAKFSEKVDRKTREELKHWAGEYKHEIRDLKEELLRGLNPNLIAKYWK